MSRAALAPRNGFSFGLRWQWQLEVALDMSWLWRAAQATAQTTAGADRGGADNLKEQSGQRDLWGCQQGHPRGSTEIKALPYNKHVEAQVILLTCLKALLPFGGRLSKPSGLCLQRCSQGEATLGSRHSWPPPRGSALRSSVHADGLRVGQDLGLLHFFFLGF